jgi:hypothetical protein
MAISLCKRRGELPLEIRIITKASRGLDQLLNVQKALAKSKLLTEYF